VRLSAADEASWTSEERIDPVIRHLLQGILPRESNLPEPIPADVAVYRSGWLPGLVGWLSGMRGPATAITIGDSIIVHHDARLTPRILRHELEHVRQWQDRGVLFPVCYALNAIRYGYDLNPYEIDARRAERER
jgi:hypothetical protein